MWKTRTAASLAAADILDVDDAPKRSGVTIAARQGLTVAQGPDDREVRYLHYVVRHALLEGRSG